MTPGPSLNKKCTSCGGLFKQSTIISGNTFRARFWTDGKMEAPMMPSMPAAVSCPHCKCLVWLSELEEASELDMRKALQVETGLHESPSYCDLHVDQYWLALTADGLDKQKEQYLRLSLMHLFNDERRHGKEHSYSARELENISSFIKLLKDEGDDQSVLMRAELLRSLGKFKEATTALERDFDYDYAKPAELIYTLALKEDRFVKEIPKDDGELADSWIYRREVQGTNALPFDPSGPPLFEIKSKDVWIKIHGMLQHSWAILEPKSDGKATVYFFYDCGSTMMRLKQYSRLQMRNRYAVVDSSDFSSAEKAISALQRNRFRRHRDGPMVGLGEMPRGNYYDARDTEGLCFSHGEEWVHGDEDEKI